jgi:hypothetical protein
MKAYENPIIEREVSMAIERILVAPYGTTWSPTVIVGLDNTVLPPGFRDCGAVVEDSVTATWTREKFQLKGGLPRVIQYESVLGVDGRLQAMLHSNSPRKMAYSLGNLDPINTWAGSPTTITSVANNTQISVSSATGFRAGDTVLLSTPGAANLEVCDIEADISSISGTTLYFSAPGPGLFPTTSLVAAKLTSVKQAVGTSQIKLYTILGVADFIDGVQLIHYIPKAASGGEVQEGGRAGENWRQPVQWDIYGTSRQGFWPPSSINSAKSELVLAERWWFPRVTG